MENKEKIYQLMDANFNRAKEGLRVIEEVCRFFIKNKDLTEKIRELRHILGEIAKEYYQQMVEVRDSKQDLGINWKEYARNDVKDLVSANFSRVEEAVRVLEEFSKIGYLSAAEKLKGIRYILYDLEKEIFKNLNV